MHCGKKVILSPLEEFQIQKKKTKQKIKKHYTRHVYMWWCQVRNWGGGGSTVLELLFQKGGGECLSGMIG